MNKDYEFIDTYYKVIRRTEDGSRYLLLGNGFSINYDKRFSFKNLFDYAKNEKLIEENSPLSNVFAEFETYDFERIIKKLEETELIFFHYNCYNIKESIKEFSKVIHNDAESLKKLLIYILSELHPINARNLTEFNYSISKNFIKQYNTIFTLNYDLLLNWTSLNLNKDDTTSRLKVNDGFGRPTGNLTFIENNLEQTIYYLHGALHIFDEGIEITKISSKDRDKHLIEQIRENISYYSKYPLFVSEGTSQNKLSKIRKNIYLNHCYNSLKDLGLYTNVEGNDSLIVFGTLLKSNDNHILEAIKYNRIKNIYIGVSSYAKIREECSHIFKELKNKNLYFYDYNTVHVWKLNFNN